ncbi:MAG TPA: glycosyltransferase family 4 protein [Pyrinomonadaceae bacterium]|nr:glycosyltransferase family 4 protein [Pyrinomonadaceae bacterium]
MRILSLNTNSGFEDSKLWCEHTTTITKIDPNWHGRSLVAKTMMVTRIARHFDVILLYSDLRLASLAGVVLSITAPSRGLVLQEFMRDLSDSPCSSRNVLGIVRDWLKEWSYRVLAHTIDAIVVHTSAEVDLYAKVLKVAQSRFIFIPYFYYDDAYDWVTKYDPRSNWNLARPKILAIGRHRDYQCFVNALAGTSWRGSIVAGSSDREQIDGKVPANVAVHYEVSRAEYRRHIAESNIVVLPFYADSWQRSLGQIAMFEAMLMHKPVIAADTFQLADYASEREILYYRPGDAEHLRQQVRRLTGDQALRRRLIENAFSRIKEEFAKDKYIERLISACEAVARAKATRTLRRVNAAS